MFIIDTNMENYFNNVRGVNKFIIRNQWRTYFLCDIFNTRTFESDKVSNSYY